MPARARLLPIALLLVAGLLVACGDGDAAEGASGGPGSGAAGDSGASDPAGIPMLEMLDVATGRPVDLDVALEPDGKAVLAWFWAPFCSTCRSEAPELDAFAADHADEVKVVGIGTRDDFGEAEDFLADTGVESFPLLWEETGESWSAFGVTAQPYAVLFDDQGAEVERWPGGASGDEVLAALGSS